MLNQQHALHLYLFARRILAQIKHYGGIKKSEFVNKLLTSIMYFLGSI